MQFSPDAHPGLADGTITRTFRLWRRPHVKEGGHYRVGPVSLQVDSVEQVALGTVDDADARSSGFADRDALFALLAKVGGGELAPETLVWRVEFHRVKDGDDRPSTVARLAQDDELTDHDIARLAARLEALDGRSPTGPWTRDVLYLIAERPGVVSTVLAEVVGRERTVFKEDVRKLKRLGLTESLERGYRLSPRGRAYLAQS